MATYKDKKIMKVISQFESVSGQKYEINGIDLDIAVFFYRASQEAFKVMTTSDYRVIEEGGNFYLEVNNSVVTAVAESYQIAYDISLLSSKYEIAFNPDINTLKDKYNQLVDDTHSLFDYIRKQALISDDTQMEIILPQLENGEVWVKTIGGWRGVNVGDIEQSLEQFWVRFYSETDAMIASLQTLTDGHVATIEATGDTQYDRVSQRVLEIDEKLNRMEFLADSLNYIRQTLDGGEIENLATDALRITADGGDFEDIIGGDLTVGFIYDGGDLEDLIQAQIDIIVDLGQG